jgi:glycosyltransferase involved in cell wall biosynthesis
MFPSESVTRVEITVDGRPLGLARIGLPRPDVAAVSDCVDAPISGWELELASGPANGAITLGGTAYGSAGSVLSLPEVAVELTTRVRVPSRGASRGVSGRNGSSVLVFTHSLGYGGAQLYLTELLERLSGDMPITVVAPADGPLRARLEHAGVGVHVLPGPRLWEPHEYDACVDSLARFARDGGFDLVLVNTISVFYGLDVAVRLGLPSILAAHESLDLVAFWAHHLWPSDPGILDRLCSAIASATTVVFEAAATRELYLPYVEPRRLVTMPYGIDVDAIDRFRSEVSRGAARTGLGVGEDKQLLVCLGTFEQRKAQASLARAFASVSGSFPDAVLALVGRMDVQWVARYQDAVDEYLARSGLGDRVIVAPLTAEPYVWHVAADVLVCASDNESLPRVILEGMAFESLVVSTAVFGIPEVVEDGVTGLLCPSRDEDALARKLEEALRALPGHDTIRAAASARVRERHDADAYAVAFRELLETTRVQS